MFAFFVSLFPFYLFKQEEVRAHFNCPLLEGAELEDQGEDGTLLTHWEKRIFEVNLINDHSLFLFTSSYVTKSNKSNLFEFSALSAFHLSSKQTLTE